MIDGWACCQKWSSGCDESCNNWLPSLPGVKFSMRIVLLLTFQFSFHNCAQSWARFTIPAQWAEFCGTFLPTRLLIQVIIYSPFIFSFRSFSPATFSLIKLHIHRLIVGLISFFKHKVLFPRTRLSVQFGKFSVQRLQKYEPERSLNKKS